MKANLKDDSTYLYLLKIAHAFVCENEDGIIAMAYLLLVLEVCPDAFLGN